MVTIKREVLLRPGPCMNPWTDVNFLTKHAKEIDAVLTPTEVTFDPEKLRKKFGVWYNWLVMTGALEPLAKPHVIAPDTERFIPDPDPEPET